VSDDRLFNIGAFSVLTGLSIPALRHYDDVGLLRPTSVDVNTAYRRYDLAQVATGRLIRALRAVEVPIDEIRAVVAAADPTPMTREVLGVHRSRLVERSRAFAGMIDVIDDYIDNGVRMAQGSSCRICEVNVGVDDLDTARTFYEAVFAVEFSEERHGDGPAHLFAAFGTWPSDEFFLLNLSAATRDPHRAGRADFGFLVADLEAVHQRALAAGGIEISEPADMDGMPRTSTVCDPSGNRINLYQNV
jgi:DNA-binding transcriptional MerR regulator